MQFYQNDVLTFFNFQKNMQLKQDQSSLYFKVISQYLQIEMKNRIEQRNKRVDFKDGGNYS